MTDRDEAQGVEDAVRDSGQDAPGGDLMETLRQAAKVLAAGAAVGAAVGAARALTSRNEGADESGVAEQRDEHETEEPDDEKPEGEESKQEDRPEPDEADLEEDTEAPDEPEEPKEPEQTAEREEPEETEEPAEAEEPEQTAERDDAAGQDGGKPVEGGSLEQTTEVVRRAREQLEALQGREPESVSSLERTPTGWTVTFEVVELARVPDSTDVLASYAVVLDEQKNVVRYSRQRRYYRSQAGREGDA